MFYLFLLNKVLLLRYLTVINFFCSCDIRDFYVDEYHHWWLREMGVKFVGKSLTQLT